MRQLILAAALLAAVPAAFGQLESDTLTITSSRTMNVVEDRIDLFITAAAPVDVTLDAVVAALRGTGVTAANLTGAFNFPVLGGDPSSERTEWTFVLTTALSNLNATLAPLANLQAQPNIQLTYSVQSAPPAAPACPWQVLFRDAQTQAQQLANAAGLKLGPIVALSDGNQTEGVARPSYIRAFVSAARFGLGILGPAPFATSSICSLTVQSKLQR